MKSSRERIVQLRKTPVCIYEQRVGGRIERNRDGGNGSNSGRWSSIEPDSSWSVAAELKVV